MPQAQLTVYQPPYNGGHPLPSRFNGPRGYFGCLSLSVLVDQGGRKSCITYNLQAKTPGLLSQQRGQAFPLLTHRLGGGLKLSTSRGIKYQVAEATCFGCLTIQTGRGVCNDFPAHVLHQHFRLNHRQIRRRASSAPTKEHDKSKPKSFLSARAICRALPHSVRGMCSEHIPLLWRRLRR